MTNNNKINEKECNETIHPVDRYVQQHRSNSSEGLPRSVVDQAESNLCVRSSRERRGRNDPSPVRLQVTYYVTYKGNKGRNSLVNP